LLASLFLSFTEWSILRPPEWVGLANYQELFGKDPLFWQSLKVIVIYTAFQVPLSILVGLSMALLLNQNVKGLSLWRTIYYFPSVVSGVAVAMLWIWVLHPEFGILNVALSLVGITGPNWLFDRTWALPTLILVSLWNVGGSLIIYLSGLQGIPTALYDAASIDGAGAWARLLHVTLPMMTPIIFYQIVVGVIGALQVFTEPYIMTNGGPANATLFYVLYLYRNAFEYLKMGKGAAMAWILAVLIMVLTAALFRSSGRWVHYEYEGREE
jgi:multiple sugar transport system permease protein